MNQLQELTRSINFYLSALAVRDARILLCGHGLEEAARIIKEKKPYAEVWGIGIGPWVPPLEGQRGLDRDICADVKTICRIPVPKFYFDKIIFDNSVCSYSSFTATVLQIRPLLACRGRVFGEFIFAEDGLEGSTKPLPIQRRVPMESPRSVTPNRIKLAAFRTGFRVTSFREDVESGGITSKGLAYAPRHIPGRYLIELEALSPITEGKTRGQLGSHQGIENSVVVLAFNSALTIEACLQSILNTISPQDEVIVVDNASTDDTASVVQKICTTDERLRLIVNRINLGYSAGCNVGLRSSGGKRLVLLNPDTVVFPGWLEQMAARLEDPSVGLVGPLSDNIAADQFVGHYVDLSNWSRTAADLARECSRAFRNATRETKLLIGLCVMARRETLDEVGLLDEDLFLGSDDLELSWRLQTHGYKLAIALDTFVRHVGGVSFASVPKERTRALVQDSTARLLQKVEEFYGWMPPAVEIWGADLFDG